MAFKKTKSPAVSISHIRLATLSAIDPALDLGNGLTLAMYQAFVQDVEAMLATYNAQLSLADEAANNLRAGEKELSMLNARMLAAVGVKYGKDSSEYEMAGGTRASEIKYARKKKTAKTEEKGPQ